MFSKIKEEIHKRLIKVGQLIYLTCQNFLANSLFESANSCSFGFIFSFIPLILIILTITVSVLKAYPAIMSYILVFTEQFKDVIDLTPLVSQIMDIKSISFVEVILGLWVIWMARKMFSSVLSGMNKIFKSVSKRRTLTKQLVVFLVEFLLVILVIFIIFGIFCLNRLLEMPVFNEITESSELLIKISSNASFFIYLVIFIFTTVIYRVGASIRPKMGLCIFYALCSTIFFYFCAIIIHKFFNYSNYNLIYGTISSVLVLMMQVWFFFNIFLFFAQMLFVTNFLDILSFGILYLLPDVEDSSSWSNIKRYLFRKPISKQRKYSIKKFEPGQTIYSKGDDADCVYYICRGTVCRYSDDTTTMLKEGSFFGEMHCVLNQGRTNTAVAHTYCEITVIKSKEFLELLQNNPKAASKAISKVSSYTAEIYGLDKDNSL